MRKVPTPRISTTTSLAHATTAIHVDAVLYTKLLALAYAIERAQESMWPRGRSKAPQQAKVPVNPFSGEPMVIKEDAGFVEVVASMASKKSIKAKEDPGSVVIRLATSPKK